MECDPPVQDKAANLKNSDSDSDFELEPKVSTEGGKMETLSHCETPESNKENQSSEEETETNKSSLTRLKELPAKPKSPFTAVNPRQPSKKAVTPSGSSRGAMLLNLSRRVSLDTNSLPSPTGPPPPPAPVSLQPGLAMVSESPLRPWVKYAPSPSHASPSASILKRPADDLDSSIEVNDIVKTILRHCDTVTL